MVREQGIQPGGSLGRQVHFHFLRLGNALAHHSKIIGAKCAKRRAWIATAFSHRF